MNLEPLDKSRSRGCGLQAANHWSFLPKISSAQILLSLDFPAPCSLPPAAKSYFSSHSQCSWTLLCPFDLLLAPLLSSPFWKVQVVWFPYAAALGKEEETEAVSRNSLHPQRTLELDTRHPVCQPVLLRVWLGPIRFGVSLTVPLEPS